MVLLVAVITLSLTACEITADVKNFELQPIPKGLDSTEIADGIILAGKQLGWKVKKISDGHLVAELYIRQHFAAVDIDYTLADYSINYRDSNKLYYKNGVVSSTSNDPSVYFNNLHDSKKDVKNESNKEEKLIPTIHRQYNNWVNNLNSEIQKIIILTAQLKSKS